MRRAVRAHGGTVAKLPGDGDVVIGEATQRLVATLVTLEPLGSASLKGRADDVKAYRVVSLERPAGAAARAQAQQSDR